ncbi:11279_t:CDS:2 [Cetraspora pellucida]|uniref:11279_t:CDS:1 n=1 Tax=Cetraspora pellucida TaxID=1433469 RepID=A0ACA9KGI0_9GLOM|nr:11279_t:CDS:2 [Cetraspora pellucida]
MGFVSKILRKVFSIKHQDDTEITERSITVITTSDGDDTKNYNNNQNNSLVLRRNTTSINTPDRTSTGARRDWRSGYKEIDELVHEMRLEYPNPTQHLIWVPFNEFLKCKQIDCGGFSTIYEANWITAGQTVALKCLKDSQDINVGLCGPAGRLTHLVKDICRGKRPPIPFGTPSFYSELMISCWDDNPLNRPDAAEISKTIYHWLVDDSLDQCMRRNSYKSRFGKFHNKKVTHPGAVYHSRLLDFKEIKEMRFRQYLSLNIPRSIYEQDTMEELLQSQSDTNNQSQPSQDITNNLQPSRDDHNHLPISRNTYNFTSNTRNSYTTKYSRSKETYKISSPTRDIYSFLPPTSKQHHGSTTIISKSLETEHSETLVTNPINNRFNTEGRPNAMSVFIPEDDIQTLQTFWALEGTNSSRTNLSTIWSTSN